MEDIIEHYKWDQYLIIERDFIDAKKYISFVPENYSIKSVFLRNEIILLGTELEEAFKKLITLVDSNTKPGNISQYKENILKYYPNLVNFKTILLGTNQVFIPFDKWDEGKLEFWDTFEQIKHGVEDSSALDLALNMLSAYEIILHLIHVEVARQKGKTEAEYLPHMWPKLIDVTYDVPFGNGEISATLPVSYFGRVDKPVQ